MKGFLHNPSKRFNPTKLSEVAFYTISTFLWNNPRNSKGDLPELEINEKSVKTNNLQEVQGAMFGISQPKANQWIHLLPVVLQQTLTHLNEMPARSMEAVTFDEENTLYFHDGWAALDGRKRFPLNELVPLTYTVRQLL